VTASSPNLFRHTFPSGTLPITSAQIRSKGVDIFTGVLLWHFAPIPAAKACQSPIKDSWNGGMYSHMGFGDCFWWLVGYQGRNWEIRTDCWSDIDCTELVRANSCLDGELFLPFPFSIISLNSHGAKWPSGSIDTIFFLSAHCGKGPMFAAGSVLVKSGLNTS